MGGCTNCSGKSGCDDRKGPMMEAIDDILARVYPTQTWGEPVDDLAITEDIDVDAIADELAVALNAATFVERGGDADACDYIWVLCMGRTPCLVQIRDHGAEPTDETAQIDELYLRVVISQRARVAAVQQVAVSLRDGVITQAPRAGVYDPPLLARMQKLVGILPVYELLHVDFGEIAHAPPGFHPGAWADLFGGSPSIANYLFYSQPTTMVSTVSV